MHESPTPPVPPTKQRNKKAIIITGAAIAIVVAITLLIVSVSNDQRERAESDRRQFFLSAQSACDISPFNSEIIDDYNSIVFERATKYDGATGEQIFCFLSEIGAPESLSTKIGEHPLTRRNPRPNLDRLPR